MFLSGVPLPPPDPAVAAGMNTLLFDFNPGLDGLSKIDVDNTKTGSFQFWVNNFEGRTDGFAYPKQTGLTIVGDALNIPFDPNMDGGYQYGLLSVVLNEYPYTDTVDWIGTCFTGDFAVEFEYAFDETAHHHALWMQEINSLITGPRSSIPRNTEHDIMEWFPSNSGLINAVRDWYSFEPAVYNDNVGNYHVSTPAGTFTTSIFNRSLYLHQTTAGGTRPGKLRWYLNDVLKTSVDYSLTAPASTASPSNPNGTYASTDTGLHYLIMGSSWPASPLYVRRCRVWGTSSACKVVQ